jgi:hypothetical protein
MQHELPAHVVAPHAGRFAAPAVPGSACRSTRPSLIGIASEVIFR